MRPAQHRPLEHRRSADLAQFEQHLRAVLDWPLGTPSPTAPYSVMVNVLGADLPDLHRSFRHVLAHDPGLTMHVYGKEVKPGRKVGHVTVTGSDLDDLLSGRHAAGYLRGDIDGEVPLVGVVMGSDSDWPVMRAAAETLDEFDVAYEVDVVSAHRMPREMVEYAAAAASRGLRVLIAGAGGAAHLPGMLASVTPLPVIGVPVPLENLDGLDSLLSIVQMPAGVPVATVSVGGARNAGLLAVRILAVSDDALRGRMVAFQAELNTAAKAKGQALKRRRETPTGFSSYGRPRPR